MGVVDDSLMCLANCLRDHVHTEANKLLGTFQARQ